MEESRLTWATERDPVPIKEAANHGAWRGYCDPDSSSPPRFCLIVQIPETVHMLEADRSSPDGSGCSKCKRQRKGTLVLSGNRQRKHTHCVLPIAGHPGIRVGQQTCLSQISNRQLQSPILSALSIRERSESLTHFRPGSFAFQLSCRRGVCYTM